MPNPYAKHISTRQTPQSDPIPGKIMVPNSAGGYTFAVDDWTRLERFLILGAEDGTYYATERKLTIENANSVKRCLAVDPVRTVSTIISVSHEGRSPKNAPAVFALAITAGTGHVKTVAELDGLNLVARTPTDLFAFVQTVRGLRGWGFGLRRLVANWYTRKTPEKLAYLVSKYQQRDGWTHRDVLRLSHPKTADPALQTILRWAAVGKEGLGEREVIRKRAGIVEPASKTYAGVAGLPEILAGFEEARAATDATTIVRLIREAGLVREHIPTTFLNDPSVWEAMLDGMPLHAMVRNLGKMTAIGLLKPLSRAAQDVVSKLGNGDHIRRSRLHPMALLIAQKIYAQGHGDKGKLSWQPVPTIVDALDAAFYLAFGNVIPVGKRRLVGLDVSGSMGSPIAGSPLSCREAAAAMAMIVAKTEPNYALMAFAGNFQPVDFSGASRLAEVVRSMERMSFGPTDCSLPMQFASKNKLEVDSFEVYTDSETWCGSIHPVQALTQYRQTSGIPAKLVVQAFTATEISIADPQDGGMLDVVGLDAAAPAVVNDFLRGRLVPVPSDPTINEFHETAE